MNTTQKTAIQEAISNLNSKYTAILKSAVQKGHESVSEIDWANLADYVLLKLGRVNKDLFVEGVDYGVEKTYNTKETVWVGIECKGWVNQHNRIGNAYAITNPFVNRGPDSDMDIKLCSSDTYNYVNIEDVFVEDPMSILIRNIKQHGLLGLSSSDGNISSCPATGVCKVTFVYVSDKANSDPATYTMTQVASWEETEEFFRYVRNDVETGEDFKCQVQRTYEVAKDNLAGVVLYKSDGSISVQPLHNSFKVDVAVGLKKRPVKYPVSAERKLQKRTAKKANKHNKEDSRYVLWKEASQKGSKQKASS